jgi:hypothetical protein
MIYENLKKGEMNINGESRPRFRKGVEEREVRPQSRTKTIERCRE